MRVTVTLEPDEQVEFGRLRKWPGAAFAFWRRVCGRRGLDPKTLIGFTALPIGHGKHWCWPYSPHGLAVIPDWIKREAERYG